MGVPTLPSRRNAQSLLVLVTDFGANGPYSGQVKATLRRLAPRADVVDLFADAPVCNPRATSYLLAAYAAEFPHGSIFLCVVDPGVGGERVPCIVEADGRWYVGPDNGIFELVLRRSQRPARYWEITWRPERLSSTFHGRDLFAPVAARLATSSNIPRVEGSPRRRRAWPDDLAEIVYVDGYGNLISGVRAARVPPPAVLTLNGQPIANARTFGDVPPGAAFWYENSSGLLEIAVNQRRANVLLEAEIGQPLGMPDEWTLLSAHQR
jgi:S-adenosylmethionine hydrolase